MKNIINKNQNLDLSYESFKNTLKKNKKINNLKG